MRTQIKVWLAALLMVVPAQACLNDRDSDAVIREAARASKDSGLPDLVSLITGRFPRNPPLFYQMRVTRVAEELAVAPYKLALYDDISVALDRLEQDDEAIRWIERKKALLSKLNPRDRSVHEHWYRYCANAGTFHVHHWLRHGADRAHKEELYLARDLIAQAIKIKPDAHFGREKYQLLAIKWMISPGPVKPDEFQTPLGKYPQGEGHWPPPSYPVSLSNYLDARGDDSPYDVGTRLIGLSGLIVLGNAWGSYDVFAALADAIVMEKEPQLKYLTLLRCRELVRRGHRPMFALGNFEPEAALRHWTAARLVDKHLADLNLAPPHRHAVEEFYRLRRNEADDWQQRRGAFMVSRLRAGVHPDTDAAFWTGWHDAGPPADSPPWQTSSTVDWNALLLSLAGIACLGLAGARLLQRRRQNRTRPALPAGRLAGQAARLPGQAADKPTAGDPGL